MGPDFAGGVVLGCMDFGEVLRVEVEAFDRIVAPDAAGLDGTPTLGTELEETVSDLGGTPIPDVTLSTEDEDVLLLTAACRIRLFSSLMILSLSSLHCLSLPCLSFS